MTLNKRGKIRGISRIVGVIIMVLAFLQWITFDYTDVHPFSLFPIFTSGMLSQMLNVLLVCVIGAIGYWFFSFGKPLKKDDEEEIV